MKTFEAMTQKFHNGLLIDGDDAGGAAPQEVAQSTEATIQENPEAKAAPQQETSVADTKPAETGNGLMVDPAPKAEASTAVATTSPNHNAVATTQPVSDTPDGDVDGSELGYGAFPKLIISNGEFQLDDTPAGKAMMVGVQYVQTQFLISPDGVQDADKDQLAYYIKGQEATTKGVSVEDFKAKLRADGFEPKESEYLMVQAVVLKFSDAVGDVMPVGSPIIMQIPGASLQRFKGIMVMMKNAGIPVNERCVKVAVGPATKSGNGKTYNPWQFTQVNGTVTQVCEKFGISLAGMSGELSDDLMDF